MKAAHEGLAQVPLSNSHGAEVAPEERGQIELQRKKDREFNRCFPLVCEEGDKLLLRAHDRTHLEFLIDYRLEGEATVQSFEWEAFFFAPQSLRLSSRTYQKNDLYTDLQSYVRFSMPRPPIVELAQRGIEEVDAALKKDPVKMGLRELKLFASTVRESLFYEKEKILEAFRRSREEFPAFSVPENRALAILKERAIALVEASRKLSVAWKEFAHRSKSHVEPVATAIKWVDEQISRLIEGVHAELALELREMRQGEEVAARAEALAVEEAQYRLNQGLDGVGFIGMGIRETERLEFRQRLLKRFSASALWLDLRIERASTLVLHLFYAIAASVAMALAVVMALWTPAQPTFQGFHLGFVKWALVVVLGYAAKDRTKAFLQSFFSDVIARHFPDRNWSIRERTTGAVIAKMREQSGFTSRSALPQEVLDLRDSTRSSPLEEEANPETVLFHRKRIRIDCNAIRKVDARFQGLTEIYRLDLHRWLLHADDPKCEIAYADPDRKAVARARAPHVYNLNVIYRLRKVGDNKKPHDQWHRARVVVSRRGIRRIEFIA
ncbi:MAG: hypothetical protein RMJ84_06545 [Sandaracinaceae bacterium]|nr:hypothetical protein [Sandaracinaceae bacterium]